MRHDDFDAILLDVGGVLLLPDPRVLGPLLAYYGGDTSVAAHHRAHYAAMTMRSAAAAGEHDWDEYHLEYAERVGVAPEHRADALATMRRTFNGYLWRFPVEENVGALGNLHERGVALGIVSNAGGQIAGLLAQSGVCQAGPGPLTPVRTIIDSHDVGVEKPDPRIFDHALSVFEGVRRERVGYVGDSVTMDIAGATAAGLRPILLDPYDDHAGASFDRIASLADLL